MVVGSWMVINASIFNEFLLLLNKELILFFSFNFAVFNVTDQDGNKVTDEVVLDYIQKVSFFLTKIFSLLLFISESNECHVVDSLSLLVLKLVSPLP